MVLEGIPGEDLCNIRSKAADKKRSSIASENKLNDILGTRYRIRLVLVRRFLPRDHFARLFFFSSKCEFRPGAL